MPNHPILYEINTRCWLRELSDRLGQPVTPATVPDEEFASWQKLGFTHIWLMGVWTTGSRARRLALEETNLRRAYDESLPGWRTDVSEARDADALPPPARTFIELVENQVGIPVRVIGVGAERDDYLLWTA